MFINTLREKCTNTEFFWSVFSRISAEYGVKCGKMRSRKTSCLDNFYAVTGVGVTPNIYQSIKELT